MLFWQQGVWILFCVFVSATCKYWNSYIVKECLSRGYGTYLHWYVSASCSCVFFILFRATGSKVTYVWSVEVVDRPVLDLLFGYTGSSVWVVWKQTWRNINKTNFPLGCVTIYANCRLRRAVEGVTLSVTQRFIKAVHAMVVNLFIYKTAVCVIDLFLSLKEISYVKRGPRLSTSRTVPIAILHRLSDTVFWWNFRSIVPVGIATRANWSESKKVGFFCSPICARPECGINSVWKRRLT